MCKCRPNVRTPFCGRPGCEWREKIPPADKTDDRLDKLTSWILTADYNPRELKQAIRQLICEEQEATLEHAKGLVLLCNESGTVLEAIGRIDNALATLRQKK